MQPTSTICLIKHISLQLNKAERVAHSDITMSGELVCYVSEVKFGCMVMELLH